MEYGMDIALKAGRRNWAGCRQFKEGIWIWTVFYNCRLFS